MSRRDTIIVAVLVNAGLLIVLFASALKSNAPGEIAAAPAPILQPAVVEPVVKKEAFVTGDEVDQALNQFSQPQTVAAAAASAPAAPAQVTPPSSSSFADDLNPISIPEPLPPSPSSQNPAMQILTAPMMPKNTVSPEFIEIKVKKGDVLEKIARHHHTTVAEVMKVNRLTSTNLRIGQTLKIPNKAIKKAETSAIAYTTPSSVNSPASTETSGAKYYTVKKGDSPWTIAVKNHLKVEELLKLNNMNEDQARRLKPGDQLRIQ